MTTRFFPVHESDLRALDRELMARINDLEPLRKIALAAFPAPWGTRLYEAVRAQTLAVLDQWNWLRGYLRDRRESLSEDEGLGALSVVRAALGKASAAAAQLRRDAETARADATSRPRAMTTTTNRTRIAGDDDMDLTYQIGIAHGQVVGYCPQTGHIVAEPLRDHARRLVDRGHLSPDVIGDDLYSSLDRLHLGDDELIEAGYDVIGDDELGDDELGDDVIGDDVIEVGAKARRKARRARVKRAIGKTVKAAKSAVKSKLGRVITTSLALANPASGAGLIALRRGIKAVSKARKGNRKASQTVNAATAVTAAPTHATKMGALKKAKREGAVKSDVARTAQALTLAKKAQQGDRKAQRIVATSDAIDNATIEPLDPAAFAAPDDEPISPQSYGEQAAEEGLDVPVDAAPAAIPDWGDEPSEDYADPSLEDMSEQDESDPEGDE